MRLPLKDPKNSNIQEINSALTRIAESFFRSISPRILMHEVSVMLADGTVTQSSTFDIGNVSKHYEHFMRSLTGWQTSGIGKSKIEDLNRIYCEIIKSVGNYDVRVYFGVQFHTLPYYRVNKKVIDILQNLRQLEDEGIQYYSQIAQQGNNMIEEEISSRGIANVGDEVLLENLLENERFYGDLVKKAEAIEKGYPQYHDINYRKELLVKDLTSFVIDLYQVPPVLIDYDKFTQGEAGVSMYVDVGTIKNKKTREVDPFLNTKRLSPTHSEQIISVLLEVQNAMDRT
ncbi:MAG TPA: hypothetical protein VE130_01675 [Nitrososphaeraceae archaeon]|nr:hypothetical protein [Nitrososphaeraceae archaeon]